MSIYDDYDEEFSDFCRQQKKRQEEWPFVYKKGDILFWVSEKFKRSPFDAGKQKETPVFRKINKDDYSAQELLELITNKEKVLLEVNLNPDYSTHRLYSYAAAGYGLEAYARDDLDPDEFACLTREKRLAVLRTKFSLYMEQPHTYKDYIDTPDGYCIEKDITISAPAKLSFHSLSEAEEAFASENSWIDIDLDNYSGYNGELYLFENNTELDFISGKLSELQERPEEIELYLSDYYGNNQGDLSCIFDEWWLQNHREYLLGLNG